MRTCIHATCILITAGAVPMKKSGFNCLAKDHTMVVDWEVWYQRAIAYMLQSVGNNSIWLCNLKSIWWRGYQLSKHVIRQGNFQFTQTWQGQIGELVFTVSNLQTPAGKLFTRMRQRNLDNTLQMR